MQVIAELRILIEVAHFEKKALAMQVPPPLQQQNSGFTITVPETEAGSEAEPQTSVSSADAISINPVMRRQGSPPRPPGISSAGGYGDRSGSMATNSYIEMMQSHGAAGGFGGGQLTQRHGGSGGFGGSHDSGGYDASALQPPGPASVAAHHAGMRAPPSPFGGLHRTPGSPAFGAPDAAVQVQVCNGCIKRRL